MKTTDKMLTLIDELKDEMHKNLEPGELLRFYTKSISIESNKIQLVEFTIEKKEK